MLTRGASAHAYDCVLCLVKPYQTGTVPVSEGILVCLVWLLEHRAIKPLYESEMWRRNCYGIWEVLERYPLSPPDLWEMTPSPPKSFDEVGKYEEESEGRSILSVKEFGRVLTGTNEGEEFTEEDRQNELQPAEGSAKDNEVGTAEVYAEDYKPDSVREAEGMFERSSSEDIDEERRGDNESSDGSSDEKSQSSGKEEISPNQEDRAPHTSSKSVKRYISHGTWYPSDGMSLLSTLP